MTRRSFLPALLSPFAALASFKADLTSSRAIRRFTPSVTPPTEDDVDRLIQAVTTGGFTPFEGWRVLWTGWKDSPMTIDVHAQWVMTPIKRSGTGPLSDSYFYISIPGAEGTCIRGQEFDVSFRGSQVGYGVDLLQYEDSDNRYTLSNHPALLAGQRVTARLALEFMRGAAIFESLNDEAYSWRRGWAASWNWEKLSAQSRFYVDSGRYITKDLGLSGDAALKAFYRLYRECYGINPFGVSL